MTKILVLANQEAHRFDHEYIGTEHILLGLLKDDAGGAGHVLNNLGVDLNSVRFEVQKLIKIGAGPGSGKLPLTPGARKVIQYAIEEARKLNSHPVDTEHLLLGILRERDGVANQILMNFGLNLEQVREEVLKMLRSDRTHTG